MAEGGGSGFMTDDNQLIQLFNQKGCANTFSGLTPILFSDVITILKEKHGTTVYYDKLIGRGSYGEVFLCTRPLTFRLGPDVRQRNAGIPADKLIERLALKRIIDRGNPQPGRASEIAVEVAVTRMMVAPNLVTTLDIWGPVFNEDELDNVRSWFKRGAFANPANRPLTMGVFLLQEFLAGGTLHAYCRHVETHGQQEVKFPVRTAQGQWGFKKQTVDLTFPGQPAPFLQTVLEQIALGLSFIHAQGLNHADLHGGNVMFGRHGTVKLIDFGLACRKESEYETVPGSVHGGRLLPEVVFGEAGKNLPKEFVAQHRGKFSRDLWSVARLIVYCTYPHYPRQDLQKVAVMYNQPQVNIPMNPPTATSTIKTITQPVQEGAATPSARTILNAPWLARNKLRRWFNRDIKQKEYPSPPPPPQEAPPQPVEESGPDGDESEVEVAEEATEAAFLSSFEVIE